MTEARIRILRHPDDQPALRAFLQQRDGQTGLVSLSESKLMGLADEVAGFVYESTTGLVGLVAINPATTSGEWAIEVVAQPEPAVVDGLIDAAVSYVHEKGGSAVRWWVYDHGWDSVARRLGFVPERELLLMGRDLPVGQLPTFPESVVVRPFRLGQDEKVWLKVNNAAFDGHPENGNWTVDDLAKRFDASWFAPEGFRMAWEGEELVGFCWTKVHPAGAGEIYVIAASPDHWGRDLGHQLVLEGLRYLHELGCGRAFLYTEGDNERAISLYGGLGFTVQKTHKAFLRPLD